MPQRKITTPTKVRPGKVTKDSGGSNKILNVGQLIEQLQTYSPDVPLNTVSHHFLREILCTLRTILEKPRSIRNVEKICAIDGCYLDNDIRGQFPAWGRDPASFWEPTLEAVLSYRDHSEPQARLRAFFSSALKLGIELKTRQIQWRFVTIVAYNHFARRYPTAKLRPDKVRDYLLEVGLEASEGHVWRCHDIITSGKRRTEFCRKLQDVSVEHAQTERGYSVNCGPMFMSSLPDDLWDNKNGYTESTFDDCLAHLLSLETGTWTTDVGCESLAKRLIEYHNELIWREAAHTSVKRMQPAIDRSPGNAQNDKASPQLAEPMADQVIATANSPWQSLVNAAEFYATQPVQDMMHPPASTPLARTEPLEGHRDTMAGIISIPSTSSHMEGGSSALPENFVNEAVLPDDFIWLWDPAGPICQDPSFYAQNEHSLFTNCGDAQQW